MGLLNTGINSYKIATLTLFLSILAPFWIAYSAMVKIVMVQNRYEQFKVANLHWFQKFLMVVFLTFLGPMIIILGKGVIAIGEVVTVLSMLTCNKALVSRVRNFFDGVSGFIMANVDSYTFDGIQKLQKNSLIFF